MSVIMVEYVPIGGLWVEPIQPTISYISLAKLACLIIVFIII